MEHILHRHLKRVLISEHDHPERIANKDGVNASLVHGHRSWIVVSSEHGDELTTFLLLTICKCGYFFSRTGCAGGNWCCCRHGILRIGRSRLVRRPLDRRNLDSLKIFPSRSRNSGYTRCFYYSTKSEIH